MALASPAQVLSRPHISKAQLSQIPPSDTFKTFLLLKTKPECRFTVSCAIKCDVFEPSRPLCHAWFDCTNPSNLFSFSRNKNISDQRQMLLPPLSGLLLYRHISLVSYQKRPVGVELNEPGSFKVFNWGERSIHPINACLSNPNTDFGLCLVNQHQMKSWCFLFTSVIWHKLDSNEHDLSPPWSHSSHSANMQTFPIFPDIFLLKCVENVNFIYYVLCQ